MSNFYPSDESSWQYTQKAENVDDLRRLIKDDRYLIGRDTSVLDGIYAGSYGGEAIVVDYNREHEFYDQIADKVVDACLKQDGVIDKSLILETVFKTVTEQMPYSQAGVNELNAKYSIKDYQKVSLAAYAHEGVGVCRHQALLVTTILEILKNRGIVRGTASIDRSIQWPEDGDPEGHAWVRYTNNAGDVYIIDVAQQFIGTLEESQSQSRGWNYLRPGETIAAKPKVVMDIGKTSTSGLIEVPDWVKNS